MTDLQEPQPGTPQNAADAHTQRHSDSPKDDAMGIRILVVLVTMFVFMFIVALVGLFFVARRP